jgi:UTP-glucose-1-phosphate uridylyltransferase
MKQLVTLIYILLTAWVSAAQTTDQDKILGIWHLDSTSGSELGEEETLFIETNKQFIYMKFQSDSVIEMPSLEDDPSSEITIHGKYYLKDNQIFVLLDEDAPGEYDGIKYTFIRDDYILLTDEGDLIYFKKDQP